MQFINPLLNLKYDQVYMYDYNPDLYINDLLIVNDKGNLLPEENIKKAIQLDNSTIHELSLQLGAPNSYGNDVMRCFIPHLAFVYYLNQKVVFHVSICLNCNNLRPSIEIRAHNEGRGMTNAFRTFLNLLLDRNDFSNNVRMDVDSFKKSIT